VATLGLRLSRHLIGTVTDDDAIIDSAVEVERGGKRRERGPMRTVSRLVVLGWHPVATQQPVGRTLRG
jgi:hypothetical protein